MGLTCPGISWRGFSTSSRRTSFNSSFRSQSQRGPDSPDSRLNDNTWTIELFVSVSAHNVQWETTGRQVGGK